MSFFIYDLIFMAIFIIAIFIFFRRNKHKFKRQGWMYLYHSTKGISFMKSFAKRFEKILKPLQYVVVACGYFLMIGIVWLLGVTLYRYISTPQIVDVVSAPPILPLVPYVHKVFGLSSFFPPLYFTYFIVTLAIVAIVHEFAHGIFAKLNNVRIKTTGFAFLGPILGAFVEQDEKDMVKAKKFPQMAILAAGTFANIVFAIIFGGILALFFMVSFAPAGVNFNSYPTAVIDLDSIDSINGVNIESIEEVLEIIENNEGLIEIGVGNENYFALGSALQNTIDREGVERALVFEDAPAVRAELRGAITSIDGEPVTSQEELTSVLGMHSPGDDVIIETKQDGETVSYNITLGEDKGNAYLGIGMNYPDGLSGLYFNFIANSKNTGEIYYETTWNGEFAWFVYYLLWWIVMINVLVALFNMLPLGILDGGRFFYLTVWGITGSEKVGRNAFSLATWAIAMVFILMMVVWLFAFF
ncbi:MAG: site-2 protease family protein [Candidatus Pacearchaeota archaeon]